MALTFLIPARVNKKMVAPIFYGVRVENNVGSPNTMVTIASGATISSDDAEDVITSVSDVDIDIATTGANGLDAGPEKADTWYYIWLIKKPDGTVAGLFSESYDDPMKPSGYTKQALVGAVRNDGSGNFLKFFQVGKEVNFVNEQTVFNRSGRYSSFVTVDPSAYVPTEISDRALVRFLFNSKGSMSLFFVPGTQTGSVGGVKVAQLEEESEKLVAHIDCLLGFEGTFSLRTSGSSLNTDTLATIFGFVID